MPRRSCFGFTFAFAQRGSTEKPFRLIYVYPRVKALTAAVPPNQSDVTVLKVVVTIDIIAGDDVTGRAFPGKEGRKQSSLHPARPARGH